MNIDGGCVWKENERRGVWKENERRGVVIIPPSIFTLRSLVTSLPRLLSLAASPVNSDGWRPRVFHYTFVMLSLCCGWGRSPPLVYRT